MRWQWYLQKVDEWMPGWMAQRCGATSRGREPPACGSTRRWSRAPSRTAYARRCHCQAAAQQSSWRQLAAANLRQLLRLGLDVHGTVAVHKHLRMVIIKGTAAVCFMPAGFLNPHPWAVLRPCIDWGAGGAAANAAWIDSQRVGGTPPGALPMENGVLRAACCAASVAGRVAAGCPAGMEQPCGAGPAALHSCPLGPPCRAGT